MTLYCTGPESVLQPAADIGYQVLYYSDCLSGVAVN
jgi:hypothetical protein